jgi:hypothetical protein
MNMKVSIISALGLIGLGLLSGCGGGGSNAVTTVPTAHLAVTPDALKAETGTPFTVTVTALDGSNAIVPTYAGTVHIVTSDSSATVPADATLPRGTGKFTVTFGTAGNYTITASDTAGNAIAGTSQNVNVSIATVPQTGSAGVAPASVVLATGGVQQFGGSASGSVTFSWSVAEGIAGGSITEGGLYTAPATPGTYHVMLNVSPATVTSGTAVVTVTDAGIATTSTGSMRSARGAYTATLLANGLAAMNGKVLIAGGNAEIPADAVPVRGVNSAELYDPATGTFATTGPMISPRYAHSATLLPNGKVLLAGGLGDGTNAGIAGPPPTLDSAELYDPTTGMFTATGSMHSPRASHTATLLSGGRVLIVGGTPDAGSFWNGRFPYIYSSVLATAEIYDIATGVFTATGTLNIGRFGHTATLLVDGTVLIAGGESGTDWLSGEARLSDTAETYDPATGTFTSVGSMRVARTLHAANLLDDGRVLITGGTWRPNPAEIFDPTTRSFSNTGSMRSVRSAHTATQLASGKVLVAGGALETECVEDSPADCMPVASMELFDPATGTFTPIGFMNALRWAHTATLLDSGAVLFAGGEDESTAELYP